MSKSRNKEAQLYALVEQRFQRSMEVPEAFFSREAERIAEACWAMARRFHQRGRLLAFGNGAWATDAQHVSVEFVHPVIVGKRALPALALTYDSATLSAAQRDPLPPGLAVGAFARQLGVLAQPQDIAIGFSPDGRCRNVLEALQEARNRGLLTLALVGGDGGAAVNAGLDFCFVVDSDDPLAVQETHETLYHILWELVHVYFEHEGLL